MPGGPTINDKVCGVRCWDRAGLLLRMRDLRWDSHTLCTFEQTWLSLRQFPNLKGATQSASDFDLYEYLGEDSWGVVFMHPGTFA